MILFISVLPKTKQNYNKMGNCVSNKNINELEQCFICCENIGTQKWCKCVRCHIVLHELCEQKYRGVKEYCECPHCHRIGSIGYCK